MLIINTPKTANIQQPPLPTKKKKKGVDVSSKTEQQLICRSDHGAIYKRSFLSHLGLFLGAPYRSIGVWDVIEER